ncbi:hypothetical protein DU478_06110 [Thalassococcus profundi]|uniref:Uncharacterized protein n=1 Tax=Thalassococcus profundi TaxID=2282382 RepID=A0A369TQX7_9RHOB|nr:DUF6477 family protein [Thalassococcus profundi]RDD67302.1 hypothetical protein DU478_06110 [Thalassococcus profundi]
MHDILSLLATLSRPRLLVRAARLGANDYRRHPHLRRLLGSHALPGHGASVMRLLEIEAEFDEQRRSRDAAYSVSDHVEVLSAVMGEARLLRAQLSAGRDAVT